LWGDCGDQTLPSQCDSLKRQHGLPIRYGFGASFIGFSGALPRASIARAGIGFEQNC